MSGGTLSVTIPEPRSVAWGKSNTAGTDTTVIVGGSDGSINVSATATAPFTFTALDYVAPGQLRSIVHAGDLFVCVGDAGTIVTVSVGQPNVATEQTSTTAENLRGVAYDATTGNFVACGDNGVLIYSTNGGATWSDPHAGALAAGKNLYGVASDSDGDLLAVGEDGAAWYSSNGGAAWTSVGSSPNTATLYSVSGDSSNWVYVGVGGAIYKADPGGTNATEITSPVSDTLRAVMNNKLIVGLSGVVLSLDAGLTAATDNTDESISDNFLDGDYDATLGGYIVAGSSIRFTETGESAPQWGTFVPLSDTYRANDYIVLSGYIMLIGTSEYDSTTEKYKYHSRRVRWTAPNTIADFSGVGSGVGDLNGRGQLLFGRVISDRGILFESDSISSISYTGLVADPWNYEVLHEGLWSISNPVVMDDKIYFVASDGLIYATNGISVDETGSPFDASEFDDWDFTKPVIMGYSSEAQSLLIFRPSSPYELHVVATKDGAYSVFDLPSFTVGAATYVPKTIVPRNDNYLSTIMVSYVRSDGAADDELHTIDIGFGASVTGADTFTDGDPATTYTDYYYMEVDTGEIFQQAEGTKGSIKHVVLRTYTDGTTTGSIAVQVKSLEDTAWHDAGDPYGTFTVDTSTCTVSGSAVSTIMENANPGDDSTIYNLPCLATQARVYVNGTLQVAGTDYTITDVSEITFPADPVFDVVAYWENEPYIRVEVGDLIKSTDGYHRVTALNGNYKTITLDRYLPSGSDDTATHVPAEDIPAGAGSVKIGLNKLTEGARLRFIIVPRSDSDCEVIKITGVSVGYIQSKAQKNVD